MNLLVLGIILFVVASLAGVNIIKSAIDTTTNTATGQTTPQQLTHDVAEGSKQNITLPIWLLLGLIVMVALLR